MTNAPGPSRDYVRKLEALLDGDRARLRQFHRGQLSDVWGFDLFTGLWWPLRQRSPRAPRRGPAWLVAKLHACDPLPQRGGREWRLAHCLGRLCPASEHERKRFTQRFRQLLLTPADRLEAPLRWAVHTVASGQRRQQRNTAGLDWLQLLEDLSIWDYGPHHRRAVDVRREWADNFRTAAHARRS